LCVSGKVVWLCVSKLCVQESEWQSCVSDKVVCEQVVCDRERRQSGVCDKVVCEQVVCERERRRRRRRRRQRSGIQNQTKNPTQRCGEQESLDSLGKTHHLLVGWSRLEGWPVFTASRAHAGYVRMPKSLHCVILSTLKRPHSCSGSMSPNADMFMQTLT
jgi:hypothetical protein